MENTQMVDSTFINDVLRHEAIILLYPNVFIIRDNIAYDAQENTVVYDDNLVDAKVLELKNQRATEEQNKQNAKTSAIAKLAALGLTQDEIKALVG